MKHLLYTVLLAFVLLGGAIAASCPANEGEPTDMKMQCWIEKPADIIYTGDGITVTCTKDEKINNAWVTTPLKGKSLTILGYNEEGVVLQNMSLTLNSAGATTFIPMVPGDYLIETILQEKSADESSAVSKHWSAVIKGVQRNPIVNRGVVSPTGAAIVEVETPDPEIPEVSEPVCEENSILDFVMNSTGEETADQASSLMLMIVGLFIG